MRNGFYAYCKCNNKAAQVCKSNKTEISFNEFHKVKQIANEKKRKKQRKKTTVTSGTISKIPFFIYKPIDIEIEIVKKSKT